MLFGLVVLWLEHWTYDLKVFGFDAQPFHFQATTLDQLLTHTHAYMHLSPSSVDWHCSEGGDAPWLGGSVGLAAYWPCLTDLSCLSVCGMGTPPILCRGLGRLFEDWEQVGLGGSTCSRLVALDWVRMKPVLCETQVQHCSCHHSQ